jgi:hypothetical protein
MLISFSNLKNYLKRIPPDELLVVGSVGARLVEFSEIKNTVPYTYFPLSDASGDRENLDGILRYALDFEKIVVFYTKYVEILDQSPVADSVTGDIIFEESVQNIQNGEQKLEEDFLYEPDIEKILAIFENQMIASLFEKKVLESDSNHLVVRTNFFGYHSQKLSLFNYFYQNLNKSVPSFGYTDVYFNPLYILDLVKGLDSIAKSQICGVTHFSGNHKLSKYEFGFQIQKSLKIDMNLILKREIESKDRQKRDLTLANSVDESTYTYQYTINTGIEDAIRRAKIGVYEN